MYEYHHTVVHVWDIVWLIAAIMWVMLWYRLARSRYVLPKVEEEESP